MRINEFIEVNREVYVVGLREGSLLLREGDELSLLGNRPHGYSSMVKSQKS